jgi:hypothetical protein
MPKTKMRQNLIEELNQKAIKQLVASHQQLKDEPLLLAVRFKCDDPSGDIHLLEVLDQFPGGDTDELLVTEFEPSASLVIVGKLHLVLGSPTQVRSALKKNDWLTNEVRDGQVVFNDGSGVASALKKELGL